MEIKLPAYVALLLQPLLEVLPLEQAMPDLLPTDDQTGESVKMAQAMLAECADQLLDHPEILAGMWLYVDDLQKSHEVSQSLTSRVGAYWHGIMHRREGDFFNAKYWFKQAPRLSVSVDSMSFVDQVAAVHGENSTELLDLQRKEWSELMGLSR